MKYRKSFTAVVVMVLAAIGCERPAPSRVLLPSTTSGLLTTGSTLIECPVDSTVSTSGTVTPLGGGSVFIGATGISVPAGAVLDTTTIVVTIPAGQYMEADVSVPGVDHYLFQLPVSISIDYSRCNRSDLDQATLSVWNIDELTKSLLENMGGTDDRTNHVVNFSTIHLSGYAIAD